jgi:recombination protein RecA
MATKNVKTAGDGVGKAEALENALKHIEKTYGQGTIMRIDGSRRVAVQTIRSGSLGLDQATGVGGLPKGRIVEVFGPESSGKTTLCLHTIANAQQAGGTAAFIDAEHAFDSAYAQALGVKLEDLLVSQPDSGEQALEVAELLVRSNAVDIVVIDSVAALVPKAELDGEMGASHVGLQARLMSKGLRKLTGCVSKSGTCLVFINQLREKIGIAYGNPEVTPGGRALKFYASMRLDIRRTGVIKEGERPVGSTIRVKVVKNKCAAPFRQAAFEMIFGLGISAEGELIDLGESLDILQRAGAWYSFGQIRLGNGREQVRTFLKEHRDIAGNIRQAIQEKLAVGEPIKPVPSEESDAEARAEVEESVAAVA